MTKQVTFDFWQVETPNGQPSFTDILIQAQSINNLAARIQNIGDRTLRFESLTRHSRLFLGDLIKLRMDELPGVASPTTPRRDLGLQRDQGITEETAFGFDPQLNVLITQRNFYGASASVIVEYLRQLTNYTGVIYTNPIVSQEGFNKLRDMRVVKKLVFKVARPKRGTIAQASETSVKQAVDILGDMGAMTVEMGISVGRTDNELSKNRVVSIVRDLFGISRNNEEVVEKILVSGKDQDDAPDKFDLIDYRIRSYQNVAIDPIHRTMTSSARTSGLAAAFREKGDEIHDLLNP